MVDDLKYNKYQIEQQRQDSPMRMEKKEKSKSHLRGAI